MTVQESLQHFVSSVGYDSTRRYNLTAYDVGYTDVGCHVIVTLGNRILRIFRDGTIFFSCCGWKTRMTLLRLRAFLPIECTRKGWFLYGTLIDPYSVYRITGTHVEEVNSV